MSLFGDVEHHLQISVGDDIPNSWVMFNWDIYQPLTNDRRLGFSIVIGGIPQKMMAEFMENPNLQMDDNSGAPQF